MLKASLAAGTVALVPGIACGTNDAATFAGAATRPVPDPTPAPATPEEAPTTQEEPTSPPEAEGPGPLAVQGEMVIAFTYTQAAGGKNEPPYVAVWIEDARGELATTVSLWYEQGRRGDRWLDHLSRWYEAEADRVASGGVDGVATVSSATRTPGSYAVVWDGTIAGEAAPAADYFVCIEAVREDGPYSLIREPLMLDGALTETLLPDDGELSAATVRIDA